MIAARPACNRPVRIGLVAVAMFGLATAAMPGCQSHKRTYAENARLRTQVIEMQDTIKDLRRQNDELKSQWTASEQAEAGLDPEIVAATPHVVDLAIGRLSHARDGDGDGSADVLVVYIQPVDGLGRFTQLTGRLWVDAIISKAQSDPVTIGRITLTPTQVRDAYRSSITGPHYTVEVPIQIPPRGDDAAAAIQALVLASYEDGLTGVQLTAERRINLDVPASAIGASIGDGG